MQTQFFSRNTTLVSVVPACDKSAHQFLASPYQYGNTVQAFEVAKVPGVTFDAIHKSKFEEKNIFSPQKIAVSLKRKKSK